MKLKYIKEAPDERYSRITNYYNTLFKKLNKVPKREFDFDEFTVEKRRKKTYIRFPITNEFVSQVDVDYLAFCFSGDDSQEVARADLFTKLETASCVPLFKHFSEIEKQFYKSVPYSFGTIEPNQTEPSVYELKLCLPGEDTPVFVVRPRFRTRFHTEQYLHGNVWKWKKTPYKKVVTHVIYSVKGGNEGIQKLLDYEPRLIHEMFQFAIENPRNLTLNRINFCADHSDNIISEFTHEIRKNHYSAGGKSIFTFPAHRWDVKGREQFDAEQKRVVAQKIGDDYRNIGSKNADRDLMTDGDWEKIDMIYIGNKRSSNVQIAVYNKKTQASRRKGRSAIGNTRIEIREVNAGRPSRMWLHEPEPKLRFNLYYYQAIFDFYDMLLWTQKKCVSAFIIVSLSISTNECCFFNFL